MKPSDFGYVIANNICLFQKGPLSQWYGAYSGQESRFFVAECLGVEFGVEFNCCEQWMMAAKARLFHDDETYKKILATKDPKIQKALGREVKNYNQATWDEWKDRIVFKGNQFKFEQNYRLKQFLLLFNRNTIFAEAAPWDKVWGIGLGPQDPDALDINKWKGENRLGEVIRKVRRQWT